MDRVDDVIRVCCKLFLMRKSKLHCKVHFVPGAVGVITTAAAIVAGPVGLIVGAVGGGLLSYWWFKDEFKALPQIIMNLSDQKKQELYNQLMQVLKNIQWTDYAHLLSQVSAQPIVKQQILEAVTEFAKDK